jgi:hypothetical protein
MTLAPETGEVSWVCMGLRRVLILAKVITLPSKSQDSSFDLEVADLEVKSHGVSPAVSGCTDSKTDPAGGYCVVARWCPAPWDLLPQGLDQSTTCPCTAASRPIGYGPMILCGNHGSFPIFTWSWRTTEGSVASSSWVKYAIDPPPPHF